MEDYNKGSSSRRWDEHDDRGAPSVEAPAEPPSRADCASWRSPASPAVEENPSPTTKNVEKKRNRPKRPEVQLYVPRGRRSNGPEPSPRCEPPSSPDPGDRSNQGPECGPALPDDSRSPRQEDARPRRMRAGAEPYVPRHRRLADDQMMRQAENENNENRSREMEREAARKKRSPKKKKESSDSVNRSAAGTSASTSSAGLATNTTSALPPHSTVEPRDNVSATVSTGQAPCEESNEGLVEAMEAESESGQVKRCSDVQPTARKRQRSTEGAEEVPVSEATTEMPSCDEKPNETSSEEQISDPSLDLPQTQIVINDLGNNDVIPTSLIDDVRDKVDLNDNSQLENDVNMNEAKNDDLKDVIALSDVKNDVMNYVSGAIDVVSMDTGREEVDENQESDVREEGEEGGWDALFTEDGDCLDPSMLSELTKAVGKVKVCQPAQNYLHFKPRDPDMDYSKLGHLIEIADFPTDFQTRDLLQIFKDFVSRGLDIKWVDDNHAIGIFSCEAVALDALQVQHPMLKVRPLSEASRQTKMKAKKTSDLMQPYKARPETSVSAARRLVSGALGVKISRQDRDKERQKLREAKDRKKKALADKEAAWNGTTEES